MEQFAQDLITANATNQISKIYDEYLDFIAVEPSVFTLNMKDSFIKYNSPALSEVSNIGYGRVCICNHMMYIIYRYILKGIWIKWPWDYYV